MIKLNSIKEQARRMLKRHLSLSTYYSLRDLLDKRSKYLYDKKLFAAIERKLSARHNQPIEDDLELIEFLHQLFPKAESGKENFENTMGDARATYDEISALGVTLENASILDIGCGYGETLLASHEYGIRFALGIDYNPKNFGVFQRFKKNIEPGKVRNTEFRSCDFLNANLEDESFDLVISVASFEHYADPAAVLNSCHRVLKKGGVLFASFDPLFLSPFGAHRFQTTGIPYIQDLFSDQAVFKFLEDKRADNAIHPSKKTQLSSQDPYAEMNRWTARQFDSLFDQQSKWEKLSYRKRHLYAYYFMSLLFKKELAKYTEEDLLTAGITVLLRKI